MGGILISVSHPEIGICCLKSTKNNYYKTYNINEKLLKGNSFWVVQFDFIQLCAKLLSLYWVLGDNFFRFISKPDCCTELQLWIRISFMEQYK